MKPETAEWIDKAEGDLKVARREMQTVDAVFNAVCFLAQQAAENAMKTAEEVRTVVRAKLGLP